MLHILPLAGLASADLPALPDNRKSGFYINLLKVEPGLFLVLWPPLQYLARLLAQIKTLLLWFPQPLPALPLPAPSPAVAASPATKDFCLTAYCKVSYAHMPSCLPSTSC